MLPLAWLLAAMSSSLCYTVLLTSLSWQELARIRPRKQPAMQHFLSCQPGHSAGVNPSTGQEFSDTHHFYHMHRCFQHHQHCLTTKELIPAAPTISRTRANRGLVIHLQRMPSPDASNTQEGYIVWSFYGASCSAFTNLLSHRLTCYSRTTLFMHTCRVLLQRNSSYHAVLLGSAYMVPRYCPSSVHSQLARRLQKQTRRVRMGFNLLPRVLRGF